MEQERSHREMIKFLDDLVDKVGGIANFILCAFLAGIIASVFMVLVAILWYKAG